MELNTLILICIIIGCILRTLLPYAKKISEGTIVSFDAQFMGTLALSIIVAIPTAISVFPQFVVPSAPLYMIIMAAILWGWGQQSVINTFTNLGGTSTKT